MNVSLTILILWLGVSNALQAALLIKRMSAQGILPISYPEVPIVTQTYCYIMEGGGLADRSAAQEIPAF